ncbi:MAG TPA: 5-amino-6-(D-ribitylamino)uracil--L-tyrosine 4-hydroxyphenyl transferase CofH [Solirubrobacteraceae bacterium]|jgi:FO synthase|nr:5-amino-6-(D-ribitylamino)uracil--L-tyrosine 4-hydroxyphenyl transferase CofH [Solirubrobacteraceae bacterium]
MTVGHHAADDVAALDRAQLLASAAARRDEAFGTRVTFSPKVFIPLTQLCRDGCQYCTFSQPPKRLQAPFLSPDQVLEIATAGATAGCHEALFTLGEAPEAKWDVASEWLAQRGHETTIDYLVEMCELVLTETGLLPHANAGAISEHDLARLRAVSASQGMMIETLRADLPCHRGAPDKHPSRRLATLEAAGRLKIPYTTGILVGIGENRQDRIEALQQIAASHARHGHVQEVIVQNFLPKPGTGMRDHPACPVDEHLDAIALARTILPLDVSVQAPPNLADHLAPLIDAGIDDWGGVSPVTADHVNPERPWPSLKRLREATERTGHVLAPRLTVRPSHALNPEVWLDETVRFGVLDRSDAEGLARDDPGTVLPQRFTDVANVGDGAEVRLTGRRSTAWCSGGDTPPPALVPDIDAAFRIPRGPVREVIEGVQLGQETGEDELVTLFSARGPEVAAVAALADELRREATGDTVTFVRTRNINYTNLCTYKCRFCAFAKGPLSLNLRGTPYLLTDEEIVDRAREAHDAGATEVCLQGGIHPSFDGDTYERIARAIHDAVPELHIHGFTALEVTEGARRLSEPLDRYLTRLKEAGLRSLPGTAAEILDDPVRAVLCPDKVSTDEWLEAHRTAHSVGLKSNVTIMFGAVEQPVSWARHLLRTRQLQRETGGFTEFVPLPFVHMASPIYLKRAARRGPTFREVVLMHAVGRIAYRGDIDNIQASWVKLGMGGLAQLLQAGVNDAGGTLMDENISRAAGASHGQSLDVSEVQRLVGSLGRTLRQRTTLYGHAENTTVGAVA